MCKICDKIGIKFLNSGASIAKIRPKKGRPTKVQFNFGNNVVEIDRSVAKDKLLER